MDCKDYPFRYSALDISRNINQGFGIKTESIRGAQAALGINNIDNSMFRLNIVPDVPSSNSKTR